MSDDYFTRLNTELAACTRRGAHLAASPRRLMRRAATASLVAVAVAVSVATAFPASAYGRVSAPPASTVANLRA
jgi:hypothetical protein